MRNDHSNCPLLIYSDGTYPSYANQEFCEFLGYSVEELRHTVWTDIVHPVDAGLIANLDSVVQQIHPKSFEMYIRLFRKNGATEYVRAFAALFYDKNLQRDMLIVKFDLLTHTKYEEISSQSGQLTTYF